MRVTPVSSHFEAELLRRGEPRIAPAGTVLFQRNQTAFGVFYVQSGSVSLRLDGAGDPAILDRTAGPGSIVGLPGTLSGPCYSLTAVTLERCELAFIGRDDLLAAIKTDCQLGMELMRALGEEIISIRRVLAGPDRGVGS